MRILFVKNGVSYTSTSSYSLDLAKSLVRHGEQVKLCARGGELQADFANLGVEMYRVKLSFFWFRKLLGFLREFDPELIHVQNLRSFRLGRRIASELHKPFVVTVHRRPDSHSPRIEGPFVRGVIAVNEVIREALVNEQNLPKGLIRVIKRGVDVAALRLQSAQTPDVERKHIPVVGTVGRLTREKGHETLIAAARRVLDGGLEAHFVIVGEGGEEPRLRKLVRDLHLEGQVTFSPHLSSLGDLYRLFDVVALPVLSSGVGATALEAMAMGKPVIASAVGEMLHLGEDGRTSVLVPEGDAGILADRIVELLSQPELMTRLGEQARAWVEENFALEPMVKATREFYEEILAGLKDDLELTLNPNRR